MSADISSREFREQIVGKRISGVVARPGRAGQPPMVLMLRFDDGSVVEFVSPRSDQLLKRALRQGSAQRASETFDPAGSLELTQLPLQGLGSIGLN